MGETGGRWGKSHSHTEEELDCVPSRLLDVVGEIRKEPKQLSNVDFISKQGCGSWLEDVRRDGYETVRSFRGSWLGKDSGEWARKSNRWFWGRFMRLVDKSRKIDGSVFSHVISWVEELRYEEQFCLSCRWDCLPVKCILYLAWQNIFLPLKPLWRIY